MNLKRTDEEINEQIDRAQDQINTGGSKFRGMSYEDGVRAAIDWLVGNSDDAPMAD